MEHHCTASKTTSYSLGNTNMIYRIHTAYFIFFPATIFQVVIIAFLDFSITCSRTNTTQNRTKDTFYFFREMIYY